MVFDHSPPYQYQQQIVSPLPPLQQQQQVVSPLPPLQQQQQVVAPLQQQQQIVAPLPPLQQQQQIVSPLPPLQQQQQVVAPLQQQQQIVSLPQQRLQKVQQKIEPVLYENYNEITLGENLLPERNITKRLRDDSNQDQDHDERLA
ncbi:2922_t:CDS:2 [Funneliformis mosseae]|uniref:2922_t:CDS:1 n=1 Tax=Funneliformis mosseae TaxID=27381 RepID=A0A9N9CV05_FUNMO|nr:2922_t:CDS:2 [Funneliformis mosseae]